VATDVFDVFIDEDSDNLLND